MLSWNMMLYGKDEPSLARRRFVNGMLILFIVAIWGLKADFIVSESWSKIGFYLSFFITLVMTMLLWHGYITKKIEMAREVSGIKFVLFLMGIPPLAMMFIWISLVHGVPSIVTYFSGAEMNRIEILDKATFFNWRHCNYRLEGEVLDRAFPSHICVSHADYLASPDSVEVTLIGKEAYFGFFITSFSGDIR